MTQRDTSRRAQGRGRDRGRHTAARRAEETTRTDGAASSEAAGHPLDRDRDEGRDRNRGRGGGGLRRGAAGTALAVVAVAALTASQAPGAAGAQDARKPWNPDRSGSPFPADSPDDGSYHTELPPLRGAKGTVSVRALKREVRTESGIPATVLKAYKSAERTMRDESHGCRLPWELLAAIGKVESGQARGGDVRADGTTRKHILGPVLNGGAFARITDTDRGAYDGDRTYDRAVGPMQFIPSTWRRWGSDGNGDGRKDPHNIHDAALAAGRYLCADGHDLGGKRDLRAAVLSYNHSEDYLRTVLAWLDFYRKGTHAVPDGEGVLPSSPGAGSDGDGDGDAGKSGRGGKKGKGKSPDRNKGKDKDSEHDGGKGGEEPGKGGPGGGGEPGPGPTDPGSPGPGDAGPGDSPGCQDSTGSPSPSPTETESPAPTSTDSPSGTPCGTPGT